MKHSHTPGRFVSVLILAALFLAMSTLIFPAARATSSPQPEDAVRQTWRRAQASGAYRFAADIVQTTIPRPTVLNVGRQSQQDKIRLEGQTNLPDQSLHLVVWSQGGSVMDPDTGVEVKIEQGKASARQGTQPWQEINDFTSLFAPEGDFMAYLAAARDIADLGPENRAAGGLSITFTRYTFRIDGRSYAAYLRDQMEKQLASTGELPPGVELDLPQVYAGMTGQGELWVSQDGLPLRQILNLQFPDRPDGHYVTAQATVDFSDFRPLPAGAASIRLGLPALTAENLPSAAAHAMVWVVVAGWLAAIIAHRRSRKLYGVLAVMMIIAMLSTPLLQSDRTVAFAERQAAQEREQQARHQDSQMMRDLKAMQSEPDFDPRVSPLDQARAAQAAEARLNPGALAAAGSTTPSVPADACAGLDLSGDADSDGLLNGEECILGTLPSHADTDSDMVSDFDEVNGFVAGGVRWYTNPLEADTNKDGLGDGQEWYLANSGAPPDTNGNGTPDLFDRDNDGDGAPDNMDLSPYFKSSSFSSASPFELTFNNLTAGKPTFVEFQLRPTDPNHLWYAMNVLDWPKGDGQGQMQDEDGKSFYDVDGSLAISPNDNGDVRLAPMLEIRITGSPTDLPARSTLDKYGISTNDLANGNTVAYVPLKLAVEEQGGQRVAFSGKMPYLPGATWGNAHQVRLAWLVQALVDVCDEYTDGVCTHYSAYNNLQVIHTYYDTWFLTGLAVREEHGTDLAIIYEDPAVDTNLNSDDALMLLAYGLDQTFVVGRDCDYTDAQGNCVGNGKRDIAVAAAYGDWSIANRFDRSLNASVPITPTRWNIPNILKVATKSNYATADDALITTSVTETKAILTTAFTPRWTSAAPISPTLMFAREERYRALNVDESRTGSANIAWSGQRLTLSLPTSGDDTVPVETLAGLQWAPFLYDGSSWAAFPIDKYWEEFGRRALLQLADETDQELKAGKQAVAQMLYLTIYKGMANVVKTGDILNVPDYQTGDKPLAASIIGGVGTGIKVLLNQYFMFILDTHAEACLRSIARFLQNIKTTLGETIAALKGWLTVGLMWRTCLLLEYGRLAHLAIAGIVVGVVAVIAGLITLAVFMVKGFLAGNTGWTIAAAVVVGVVLFALTVLLPVYQVIKIAIPLVSAAVGVAAKAGVIAELLSKSSAVIGASNKAGVVGMVIAIGVAVGVFIYALTGGGVAAMGSVAIQTLLAQTIAAIIVAVIQFVLSTTIVGTIILSVISVIDLILILCGVDFTITGWITEQIAKFLYHFELIVDTGQETSQFNSTLVNAEKGLTAGNQIRFDMNMRTAITHTDPTDLRVIPYLWLYTSDYLRSTSFKYEMNTRTYTETGLSTQKDARKNDWIVAPDHKYLLHQMYRGVVTDALAITLTLPAAGVNRTMAPLKLNSAFAMPGISCWTIPIPGPCLPWMYCPIPICYKDSVDGQNSTEMGASIVMDIYPTTLDGFMKAGEWCEGCTFQDADGDGLLSAAYAGNDPDDTRWDKDGDGLSDAYEVQLRARPVSQGGIVLDPLNPDTDGDLIWDGDEIRRGTNPAHSDTDGDGITDKQELDGYTFTYASGKTTQMFTDPLQADQDHDGMDDLFERTLHTCPTCDPLKNPYSPHTWNPSPLALYPELGDADSIVAPGQALAYTVTAKNNLRVDLAARGTANLGLPSSISGGPRDMYFDLLQGQAQSLVSNFTIANSSGNARTSVTNTMSAQLQTPSAWAWDAAQTGSLATTAGAGQGVAIAAVSGWNTPYVAASLEGSGTSERIVGYQATPDGLTGAGTYLDGGADNYTRPDIACANNGVCLIVWTKSSQVLARPVGANLYLTPRLTIRNVATGYTVGAASVATDGTNFLVAWREDGSTDTLQVVRVSNAGGVGMVEQIASGSVLGEVDVALAGERYVAVWARDGDIWSAYVSKVSGFTTPWPTALGGTSAAPGGGETLQEPLFDRPAGSVTLETGMFEGLDLDPVTLAQASTPPVPMAATAATESNPAVAYDALSRQVLIVYQSASGSTYSLRGRTLSGASLSAEFTLDNIAPANVAASADPINGGWVVAWGKSDGSGFYQAVGPTGSLRGAKQTRSAATAASPQVGLACTAPRPMLLLAMDEAQAATTFTDSSGYGRNAPCPNTTVCPAAGVEGRGTGNAARFDGSDDYLRVTVNVPENGYAASMWFKTTCQNCGLFQVDESGGGYDRNIYLSSGNVCARIWSDQTICSSGDNFADGNWHQVVHTFGSLAGGQYLYVDGKPRATGSKLASDFTWQTSVAIGYSRDAVNDYLNGDLDDVTLYGRALSAGEISASYIAALAIFGLDEPAGSSTFKNDARNSYTAACSGSACPDAGQAGQAYAAAQFDGAVDTIQVANLPRTVAEYLYDFQSTAGVGWSSSNRATTPAGASRYTTYLGPFENGTIFLNLDNLPTHDQVEIEFDVYVIASWDGARTDYGPDYWEWGVDGAKQLRTTFSNAPDACGNWQFYPGEPSTPYGVYLHRKDCDHKWDDVSELFTSDDHHLGDNPIGNDKAHCWTRYSDSVSVIYQDDWYGGKHRLYDGARGCSSGNDWTFEVSSIRVWKAAQRPRTGAAESNTLGTGQDAVYHISKTFDGHTASALSLYFKAWNLEGSGNETWGLDNVRVRVKSRNVPLADSSFSLAAWAKRDTTGTDDVILGQGWNGTNRGLFFGFRSNNKFTCAFWGNDLDTPSTYTDTNWHHWACTYDAATKQRKIYRDGVLLASGAATANFQGYGTLSMGSFPTGYNFDGLLDEVAVWDQVLSADQIATLYRKVKVLDDSVLECLMPSAYTNATSLWSSRLSLRETTTFLGNNNQQGRTSVTIDADTPTSQLTSLTGNQYLATTGTLIVGGVANDFAAVAGVQVSVDGGAWRAANGGRVWAFDWDTRSLAEGPHTLRTRATDAVGHVETPGAGLTVILDRQPPQLSTTIVNGVIMAARLDAQGRWVVPLSGTVSDPAAGSSSGSGVQSVEVLLEGSGAVSGQAWQTAQLSGNAWTLNYILPFFNDATQPMPEPTGSYLFITRATDWAGNQTPPAQYPGILIRADNTAPVGKVTYTGPSTTTITTTLTLSGVVTDVGAVAKGISKFEIGFVPAEQEDVLSETATLLHLDEPVNAQRFDDASGQGRLAVCGSLPAQAALGFDESVGATRFADSSGQGRAASCASAPSTAFYHLDESYGILSYADASGNGRTGTCSGASCPAGGHPGRIGTALNFDGTDDYIVLPAADALGLKNGSFTVAAWVNTGTRSFSEETVVGTDVASTNMGLHLVLRNQKPYMGFYGNDTAGKTTLALNNWYHIVWRYNLSSGEQAIFVNGQLDTASVGHAPFQGTGVVKIGRWASRYYFDGKIDEVAFYNQALSDAQIAALYRSNAIPGTTCPTPGATGQLGSALAFDGVDDYVTIPDSDGIDFTYNQDLAVSAWIRVSPNQPDKGNSDNDIIEKWSGSGGYPYVVRYINRGADAGKIIAARYDGSRNPAITSARPINDGQLHHVAFVRQAGTLYLYIDGMQAGTTSDTTTGVTTNNSPLYIGARGAPSGDPYNHFAGLVDHLLIYNRGLSANEVMALYLGGSAPTCPTAGDTGQINRALTFDGVDDYLNASAPTQLAGHPSFSVAFWVKYTAQSFNAWVVDLGQRGSAYNALRWVIQPNGTLQAGFEGGVQNSVNLSAYQGQWALIITTYDAAAKQLKTYLNGAQADSDAVTGTPNLLPSGGMRIGLQYGADGKFKGSLDEVAILGRALSAEEARYLYLAGNTTWANTTLAQPGAVNTTWTSPVPGGLEGFYQVNLRGTDLLGNLDTDRSTWRAWRGLIDVLAPRAAITVTYQGTGSTAQTIYDLWAQDLNLKGSNLTSPCAASTYQRTTYDQVSAWYRAWTTDTTRLYRVQAHCAFAGHQTTLGALHACDLYGRCTDKTPGAMAALRRGLAAGLDVAVLTPTVGSVLTAADPISITGGIYAPQYAKALTVSVDGAPIQTFNWANGSVTDTAWAAAWTPSGEGAHVLLASASDWAGNAVTSEPVTVTLDTLAPTIDIAPTVITTTRQLGPGRVTLAGPVADAAGVASVQARVDGGVWLPGAVQAGAWRMPWYIGQDPDGVAYNVTAEVTDLGGRTAQAVQAVIVDIVPPAPVTLTLTYTDSTGAAAAIQPGMTIHDVPSPTLRLGWTASSDGSGLGNYLVKWVIQTNTTTTETMFAHPPAGSLTAQYQAGDAQVIVLEFASQDGLGNQTWQTFGPIYVDSRFTLDYAPLGDTARVYHGWLDSGCSLIGVDHRVNQYAPDQAALSAEQKLYATWNAEALRLAWTGAHWGADGHLFVYLDTQPGGVGQLFNPYDTALDNVAIYLPGNAPETTAPLSAASPQRPVESGQAPRVVTAATVRQANAAARASTGAAPLFAQPAQPMRAAASGMLADYVVWVKGPADATLLRWDGSAWVVQTQLDKQQYDLDTNATPAVTDLYLPFSLLGIADPASSALDLLAVASQKDSLRLWAVMPERNPVNAAQAVNPLGGAVRDEVFTLSRQYHWDMLGSGQCPNGAYAVPTLAASRLAARQKQGQGPAGGPFADSDLHVSITLDPAGTSYAFMNDNLAWLWNVLFGGAGGQVNSQNLTFLDVQHSPLGDGQQVTYTIHYANRGSETATGVKVDINAYYSLDLPDGVNYGYWENKTIDLGDLAPGVEATRLFTGTVSVAGVGQARYDQCRAVGLPHDVCEPMRRWASLDAYVYDDRSPLVYDTLGNPTQPPLEWIWVDHRVDSLAPDFVGIDSPSAVIRPGANTVRGYVHDESGVPAIALEWRTNGGVSTAATCADATPNDGQWACDVTIGAAGDGATVELRARATDQFGHTSDWTAWQPLVVDTVPPVVSVDADAWQAINGQALGPGLHILSGQMSDNHFASSVQVCYPGATSQVCEFAAVQLAADSLTQTVSTYDDVPDSPLTIDAATTCDGAEIVRTFNVADDYIVGAVNVGFNADHARRDDIQVELESPSGTRARIIFGLGSMYDPFRNYDVLLRDSSAQPLHTSADDDTAEPYYGREARPYQALAAFNGENAAGVWELYICDVAPASGDGAYNRSRLILTSRAAVRATSGTWRYTLPVEKDADDWPQTFGVYGVDAAGNRTLGPITLGYQLDVVPPALAVNTVVTQVLLSKAMPVVLGGLVSDGSGQAQVYIRVDPPEGASYSLQAVRSGTRWSLTPALDAPGVYTLWVEARDGVGNTTPAGPYRVQAVGPTRIYLPIVAHRFSPKPDLVGSFSLSTGSITPGAPVTITVTITNQGNAEATGFWVDFYINPSTPPTAANQPWETRCSMTPCYGIRWEVLTIMRPGESLTLRSTPDSYDAATTYWLGSFPTGTRGLYLYVDSRSPDGSPNGLVLESIETNNLAEMHGAASLGVR